MYEKLGLLGLKGFAEKQSLNLAKHNGNAGSGLTILVGPNNGGKSTIIDAVRALAQPHPPTFSEGKRNKAAGDKVELELVIDGKVRRLKTIALGGSETEWDGQSSGGPILVMPARRYFEPYFGRFNQQRNDYEQHLNARENRAAAIGFHGRLQGILNKRADFNRVLEKIINPVPDWTIEQSDQGQYYLKFKSGTQHHNSEGLGDGIISLFFIVDALYDSAPDSLIAFDEPELSLHPSLQKKVAALLSEYAKDRQILLATHSPYFVDFGDVSNGAQIARVAKDDSKSGVYELKPKTIQDIQGLLRDSRNPHVLGLDAREAFFLEEKIILVEGQEDVLLYPKVLSQLGIDIKGDFFGWGGVALTK